MSPRLGLLSVVLLLGACAEDVDPLDPDVVNALSRTAGNESGFGHSGDYSVAIVDADCDACDSVQLQLLGLTPCNGLIDFGGLGGSVFTTVSVIHSDGILRLRGVDVAGTGPVDTDGSFAVGRVASISAGIGEGSAVARIEGDFDGVGDFEATMRQRIVGHIGDEAQDCRATFELDGRRL